jgi:hypothetical protein
MTEIGKIKIIENSGEELQILFNMSKELSEILDSVNDSSTLPLEHRFSVSSVENQAIAIFSQNDSMGLSIEENVAQKGECRPVVSSSYSSLNKERIKKAAQPLRVV